jgi:hypothetical protein
MRDHRLPAIYQWPESAEDGGLLAYGPRQLLCYRHVMSIVDKVLRGAKPARSADRATIQIRTGRKPEDSEHPRYNDPTDALVARRRGDRIIGACCDCSQPVMALLGLQEMTDLSLQSGPKRTLSRHHQMTDSDP